MRHAWIEDKGYLLMVELMDWWERCSLEIGRYWQLSCAARLLAYASSCPYLLPFSAECRHEFVLGWKWSSLRDHSFCPRPHPWILHLNKRKAFRGLPNRTYCYRYCTCSLSSHSPVLSKSTTCMVARSAAEFSFSAIGVGPLDEKEARRDWKIHLIRLLDLNLGGLVLRSQGKPLRQQWTPLVFVPESGKLPASNIFIRFYGL